MRLGKDPAILRFTCSAREPLAARGTGYGPHVLPVILQTVSRKKHKALTPTSGLAWLIVPRHRRTIFDRRAFTVAGPTAWNSLPDYLRYPSLSEDTFRRLLKTYLFALY